MNLAEAKSFLKESVLVALPAVAKFILMNSPDSKATLAIWSEAIEGLELVDCKKVLSEWVCGTRDPLTDAEVANFPSTLIAACRPISFKKAHSGPLDEIRRVDPSQQSAIPMRPYLNRIWDLRSRLKSGEITLEQFKQGEQEVLDQHEQDQRASRSKASSSVSIKASENSTEVEPW
jgi:hypothetical protein